MSTHEVVYVGGPRHGEREAREGDAFTSPDELRFLTDNGVLGPRGVAIYRRVVEADTPGAIAYVYDQDRST